jgi:hypothetical protein
MWTPPQDVHALIGNIPLNAKSETATFLRRGPGMRVKAALASLPPMTYTTNLAA